MYFWLKFFHIATMAVWFTGLFFLPRLFLTHLREAPATDHSHLHALGRTLYFGLMTPASVVTIVLGTVLLAYGFEGAWLPAKLVLVTLAVLLHLLHGQLLRELRQGRNRHGVTFYRLLTWSPLLLLLAVAALAAAKPGALPPFDGV